MLPGDFMPRIFNWGWGKGTEGDITTNVQSFRIDCCNNN